FMHALEAAVQPLFTAPIEDVGPFEQVLAQLQKGWGRSALEAQRSSHGAIEVLRHAEQRNLLAEKVALEIQSHPDAARVPSVVMDFLCGPWAQVLAQARIVDGAGSATAEKFHALISALLWSTQPSLTRKNYAKLTRLLPMLLSTLREGLESIHYPVTRTSVFLEALMGLHQMAFRAAQRPQEEVPEPEPAARPSRRLLLVERGDPWVAPEEARATNFLELPDSELPSTQADPVDPGDATLLAAPLAEEELADPATDVVVSDLPLGSWIEMYVGGQWLRTQLTWASPHGTLFLFTSVFGSTQSITRRSCDKMAAAGNLRVVSGQPVVDGALNAVAQQAMRNSVDTSY
ncbi:MAG: DUF1631 family protein, partial [Rhodoferax sp.]